MPAQYKLLIKLGLILAAIAAAFMAGWRWNGSIWNGKVLTLQNEALVNKAINDAYNTTLERQAQDAVDQIALLKAKNDQIARQTQSSIQKGIADYAKAHPTPTCLLDSDWMRLHDAAALHVSPDSLAAGRFTGATASPADTIGVISHNYDVANQCLRDQALWIDYANQVSAILNKDKPK